MCHFQSTSSVISVEVAVAGDYFADGLHDILFITNADLTDFTLFDAGFVQDFVYDVTPVAAATSRSTGVTPDSRARSEESR
jgi:hypothetical protein